MDRFFKFVSLELKLINLYITCVIYRRASHAGPSAPLCFARIRQELGGTGTGCLFQITYCEIISLNQLKGYMKINDR